MLLLGGGLGLTTAPATEAIMGSLSADKAGVGSAVNDTTREFGGTLGVAIAGSVFASVYSGHLGAAPLDRLPAEAMGHSMALAHRVIEQLPAATGRLGPRRRQSRLPGRPAGELAGLRGYRAGRGDRRRWLLPARAQQPAPSPETRHRQGYKA